MELKDSFAAGMTFIATGLGLGRLPPRLLKGKFTGAGLIGSLEGMALMPWLPSGGESFAVFLLLACLLACWLCGVAEKRLNSKDDPGIILDEVVGYWAAAAFLPRSWSVLVAALVAFRFFDVAKFSAYRWMENLPGGIGVVADDLGAALCANVAVRMLQMAGALHA